MKTICLAGRIGKDAVTRTTQGGQNVTGFSLAVDDGWGDNKRTLWFDCSFWGKRGDSVARFLIKGAPVCVSGDLSTREYEGKTYLTVNVNDVTLQGKQQEQGGANPPAGAAPAQDAFPEDSIPFAPEFR